MANHSEIEKLLLRIMHLINQNFKSQAVLKGGMHLRLLNSPRYTQDIDYVFSPKISRNVIAKELNAMLAKENDLVIQHQSLNSRGAFFTLECNGVLVKLEISLATKLNCPSETQSTTVLASQFQMPPEIVTTLAKEEAYAHKIAASLERNVMRDLYDISIYEPLTSFDSKTLKLRFKELSVGRNKPKSITFLEASEILKKKAAGLTQKDIEEAIGEMLPHNVIVGTCDRIKMSLNRLCQQLETL